MAKDKIQNSAKQIRLLLVDDDHLCLQSLKNLIVDYYGYQTDMVTSATEALDLINTMNLEWNPKWYDLIFMDIQMPTLQGDIVSQLIRQAEKVHEIKMPIVAITSNLQSQKKQNFSKIGVTDILIKPITKKMLDEIFNKYLPPIAN